MGLETIVGIAALIMAAIAGAFGIGHSRGTSKAEAKADLQRTEEKAAATEAVAGRQTEVITGAINVQEDVKRMSNDAVNSELRKNFTRPGGR